MKQHITVEQYRELLEKFPKDIIVADLCKLLNLNLGDLQEQFYNNGTIQEMITIGRMIEIVKEKHEPIIETDWFEDKADGVWWTITLNRKRSVYFSSKELADALWEAVKHVLGENDETVL